MQITINQTRTYFGGMWILLVHALVNFKGWKPYSLVIVSEVIVGLRATLCYFFGGHLRLFSVLLLRGPYSLL